MRILTTAAVLFAVAPAPLAQLPPHAVQLNPSGQLPRLGAVQREAHLVQAGDVVHFVVRTYDRAVRYSRSPDGGRTWPIREQVLAFADQATDLVASGDTVVVAMHSFGAAPAVVWSADGGTTWAAPVPVTATAAADAAYMLLHADGTTVIAVWRHVRPGGAVWANRSTDGGATWGVADQQLDTLSPLDIYAIPGRVAGSGATVNVFWTHGRFTGPTVVAQQRSVDGGATWLPATAVLWSGEFSDAAGDGASLLVAGNQPGALLRSSDQGATWVLAGNTGIASCSGVALAGSRALAIGTPATANGAGLDYRVLANTSLDGGVTWAPAPVVAAGPIYSYLPAFDAWPHVAGGAFFVETRPDYAGSVALHRSDDGAAWRTVQGPLWTWHPGPQRSIGITTWSTNALWAYVSGGHTPVGAGTAGTGGIEPRLRGDGMPGLGSTFALAVDEARGGSFGLFGVSFGLPAPSPLGSATLWLQQPMWTFGFTTNGAPGAAGAGAASLSFAVPSSGAFIGFRLTSQAIVVDAAAADGFAATRAMESWIR